MKIALQLFGHLRTFEETWKHTVPNLVERHNCDVFMHTWDEMDSSTFAWNNKSTYQKAFNKETIKAVKKIYKPKKILIEHQENKEEIIVSSADGHRKTSLNGIRFMFHSMGMANQLRKEYESETGVKYDIVLCTRPDVAVYSFLDIEKVLIEAKTLNMDLDRVRFFATNPRNNGNFLSILTQVVNDILFFGKREVIDKYIHTNTDMTYEYATEHIIGISTIFTSKEIAEGIIPVPLNFLYGVDWKNVCPEPKPQEQKKTKTIQPLSPKYKDISVVVQGAIDKKLTQPVLKSVRRVLPGATIILSTWKESVVSGLDYDILVENDDPGAEWCNIAHTVKNNVNRQIISSKNGIANVKTKYSLKLRSDISLKNTNFIKYFDKFDDKRNEECKVFNKRIVINNFYCADRKTTGILFHISDWVQFGLTEDMLKLWDIPLQKEPESSNYYTNRSHPKLGNPTRLYRYIPEQYIWTECLKKNGTDVNFNDYADLNGDNARKSDLAFANNVVIVDYEDYGIKFNKFDPYVFDSYYQMDHFKWQKLYKKYCDQGYVIPNDKICDYDDGNIENFDISFVIQGVLNREITPLAVQNIRQFFPGAEIAIATYDATDIAELDYDKIVLVKDPGAYPINTSPNAKINNVNRQIATTVAGLRIATRKYIFKLRTDFILTGRRFLDYFKQFQKSDPNYRVFEKKILSCVFFARNPRNPNTPFPFHPSDIAFFGLHSDLLNLFDIPFMDKDEFTAIHRPDLGLYFHKWCPEQYIWTQCLKKNDKKLDFEYFDDMREHNIVDSEQYAVSNFIYLDWKQFNLIPPKHLVLSANNKDLLFDGIITHIEWQRLYKQYLDNSLAVPNRDDLRELINREISLWSQNKENNTKNRSSKMKKFIKKLLRLFRRILHGDVIRALNDNAVAISNANDSIKHILNDNVMRALNDDVARVLSDNVMRVLNDDIVREINHMKTEIQYMKSVFAKREHLFDMAADIKNHISVLHNNNGK